MIIVFKQAPKYLNSVLKKGKYYILGRMYLDLRTNTPLEQNSTLSVRCILKPKTSNKVSLYLLHGTAFLKFY